MKALVEELVKLAAQAGLNYSIFFDWDTKEKMATKADFLESWGEWSERYFGRQFDRKEINEIKQFLTLL